MMSDADRKKAAQILIDAARTRLQAQQLTKTVAGYRLRRRYAISTEVAERRMAAGAKLIGYKIGLAADAGTVGHGQRRHLQGDARRDAAGVGAGCRHHGAL